MKTILSVTNKTINDEITSYYSKKPIDLTEPLPLASLSTLIHQYNQKNPILGFNYIEKSRLMLTLSIVFIVITLVSFIVNPSHSLGLVTLFGLVSIAFGFAYRNFETITYLTKSKEANNPQDKLNQLYLNKTFQEKYNLWIKEQYNVEPLTPEEFTQLAQTKSFVKDGKVYEEVIEDFKLIRLEVK